MHIMDAAALSLYLKIFYSIMVLIVISMMAFYVKGLTSKANDSPWLTTLFYSWIGFLVVAAISFHILTAMYVPWVHWEISRKNIKADHEISISANNHKFLLPEGGIKIKIGDVVKFKVISHDLTYGFGVFRQDAGMEFQMQVIPHYSNDILWIFRKPGKYSIRCTEYAGTRSQEMYLKDSIEVFSEERSK